MATPKPIFQIPASEVVDREFKPWLRLPSENARDLGKQAKTGDKAVQHGISEFVRTCAALYNNDGGELHLGRKDPDGLPTGGKSGSEIHTQYSADKVLIPLLSAYLIPVPQIRPTETCSIGNLSYLRIPISPGVTVPAALRNEIIVDGEPCGRGTIFVRETSSNGKPSTSALRNEADWYRLMNRCIKNRGADVIGPAFMEVGTLINRCDPNNLEDKNSDRGKDGINHTEYQTRCIADALAHLDFNEVRDELWAVADQLTKCQNEWIGSQPAADATNDAKVGWVRSFREIVVRHRGSRFTSKE